MGEKHAHHTNPWLNPKTRAAIMRGIRTAARNRRERNAARRARLDRSKRQRLQQLSM